MLSLSPRSSRGPQCPKLRLASASPRRRLLLPLLGYPVEVTTVQNQEQPREGEAPSEMALRLAREKAAAAAKPRPEEVVVGADTIVVLDGRQLGKPLDANEARRMLFELRGRPHEVISAIALLSARNNYLGAIRTVVQMRAYSEQELEQYIQSGRPLDKAGAYAIQDREFGPVERIEGCYLNVVGLPLCEVSTGLRALGWPIPAGAEGPDCSWCQLGEQALAE
jgi:septum formation protein